MPPESLPADNPRRLALRLSVKIMLWLAVLMTVWVLFSPFGRETQTRPLSEQISFPVGDMQIGEVRIVEWLSKPLIIVRRSSALEAQLIAADEVLYRDPLSQASVQPESALNAQRSHTDNWFVALGLGTGMGCALTYKPAAAEIFQGKPWSGGFVDGCDAAHYDLAGRVYADQKARLNLTVPVWELVDQQLVLKPQ